MALKPRMRLALAATIAVLVLAGMACAWPFGPRHEGKYIRTWFAQLKISVKVLQGPGPTYTVLVPNLSDAELRRLRYVPKAKVVGANEWLGLHYTNYHDFFSFARASEDDPAARAFQAMGKKAVPFLQSGLRARESRLHMCYARWVWPYMFKVLKRRLGQPLHPSHTRANAAYALGCIGPEARWAAEDLKRVASQDPDLMVRSVAFEALHKVAPELADPFYPDLFPPQETKPAAAVSAPVPQAPDTNRSELFSPSLTL